MEQVIEHGLITAGIHAIERLRKVRFLKSRLIQPNADVRVAFSAILRIQHGGRYLLVRNLHRPESFAPFGGVIKYHEQSKARLDDFSFCPQDIGPDDDMKNDLRGFLPRKNLSKLVKFFAENNGRESGNECLNRELREELSEIGLSSAHLTIPSHLEFAKIRSVEEGPEKVPGQNYTQFRIFEVYEQNPQTSDEKRFFEQLYSIANNGHLHLLIAHADELRTGRTADGRIVGSHCAYFQGKKRHQSELPAFVPCKNRTFASIPHQLPLDLPN